MYKVKRSNSGLGLFANKDFKRGEFIIEYKGRKISETEEYTSKSRYLFYVGPNKTIDGSNRRNKARYINHSCKPNSEAFYRNGRVFIHAKKVIRSGEEITITYGKHYCKVFIKKCKCKVCE